MTMLPEHPTSTTVGQQDGSDTSANVRPTPSPSSSIYVDAEESPDALIPPTTTTANNDGDHPRGREGSTANKDTQAGSAGDSSARPAAAAAAAASSSAAPLPVNPATSTTTAARPSLERLERAVASGNNGTGIGSPVHKQTQSVRRGFHFWRSVRHASDVATFQLAF
jgi:uncharacterized protein involved in copper resistance